MVNQGPNLAKSCQVGHIQPESNRSKAKLVNAKQAWSNKHGRTRRRLGRTERECGRIALSSIGSGRILVHPGPKSAISNRTQGKSDLTQIWPNAWSQRASIRSVPPRAFHLPPGFRKDCCTTRRNLFAALVWRRSRRERSPTDPPHRPGTSGIAFPSKIRARKACHRPNPAPCSGPASSFGPPATTHVIANMPWSSQSAESRQKRVRTLTVVANIRLSCPDLPRHRTSRGPRRECCAPMVAAQRLPTPVRTTTATPQLPPHPRQHYQTRKPPPGAVDGSCAPCNAPSWLHQCSSELATGGPMCFFRARHSAKIHAADISQNEEPGSTVAGLGGDLGGGQTRGEALRTGGVDSGCNTGFAKLGPAQSVPPATHSRPTPRNIQRGDGGPARP